MFLEGEAGSHCRFRPRPWEEQSSNGPNFRGGACLFLPSSNPKGWSQESLVASLLQRWSRPRSSEALLEKRCLFSRCFTLLENVRIFFEVGTALRNKMVLQNILPNIYHSHVEMNDFQIELNTSRQIEHSSKQALVFFPNWDELLPH